MSLFNAKNVDFTVLRERFSRGSGDRSGHLTAALALKDEQIGKLTAANRTLTGRLTTVTADRDSLQRQKDDHDSEHPDCGTETASPMRSCPQCRGNFPNTPAFFGASHDALDLSLCAACSRTRDHRAGLPHFANGCAVCMAA